MTGALPSPLPRVAVVVASTGRPQSLATMLRHLQRQTLPPARIVLSVVTPDDLPPADARPAGVECLNGPRGLPAQRNTALRHLDGDADVVVFFDDDYVPSRFCVEQIARFFAAHPGVAGANGHVIADGIGSAGISTEEAERLVEAYDQAPEHSLAVLRELEGLYGCNMAFRTSATRGIWFDERLRLYGWQEDIDFAARVARNGAIVKTRAFAGVHQGVKGARTSGLRLGYSQVVNPCYLVRKGTMSARFARRLVLRNLLANHLRAAWPEPWVDRLGRVRGNWVGIADVLRGRLTPERIESL